MKNIKVVIGANFGDEGKGLMTDYFASRYRSNGIVVRFNGGAQAGHTVVTPEGIRHVFSHIGSGTLVGLPTFLSEDFILNPILFKKERIGLAKKHIEPKIYFHPKCIITTPYDMLINQIVEHMRGDKRHGSCGVGIYETIQRSRRIPFHINNLADAVDILDMIRKTYVYFRLQELGVNDIPIKYLEILNNDNVLINYIKDLKYFINNACVDDGSILSSYKNIVFEGAQGLLLDQNNKQFYPNLTPSNTGMQNPSRIIKNLGDADIEAVYVTRWYMTRHGAGEFPTETDSKPSDKVLDMTNTTNDHQGSLRFGNLDWDLLKQSIDNDMKYTDGLNCKASLAMTCLDQLEDGIPRDDSKDTIHTTYQSYGMTRESILKN